MKKNILLTLTLVLFVFSFNLAISAQHQRLGIKSQRIDLTDDRSSVAVEAYCFDRHVIIGDSYNYGNIHTDDAGVEVTAGGKSYNFSKAIKNRIIEIKGRPGRKEKSEPALVIEIVKLVPGKVSVDVKKTSVFRDTPGTYSNQTALANLAAGIGPRGDIQDAVWKADIDRTRLESLGFKSIRECQEAYGLPKTNTFDTQTSAKLESVENALISIFERNYLKSYRVTKIKSISDNIVRLQQVYGIKGEGVFGPEILQLFKKYQTEHIPIIKGLGDLSTGSDSYVLRVEPSSGGEDLYTFYSPSGVFRLGDTKTLTETLIDWSKNKSNKDVHIYGEGFAPGKAEALRTSLDIHAINMLRNDSTKGKFLLIGEVSKVISTSPVKKVGNEFRGALVFKTVEVTTNQTMTVTSKLRNTTSKFLQNFKRLVNGKRSLPSIVSEARKSSGAVRLGFRELGEIEIVKLFPAKSFEIKVE